MVSKVLQTKQPKPLYNMFPAEYTYNTSQARSRSIKQTGQLTLDLWKDSFRWREARSFNLLPATLKSLQSSEIFKLEAKKWIRANVTMYNSSQD